MGSWDEVAALAGRQHGIVTRQQCLRLGIASATLADHIARFHWRALQPGVYAVPGAASSFAQRATAAGLSVGPPSALTGGAALHLLGISDTAPATMTIVVPDERALPPRQGVEIVRTKQFSALRLLHKGPMSMVSAARAAADFARHLKAVPLGRLMARGCALRQASLASYDRELSARRRFPGRAAFREALAMLGGELTHSSVERAARRHARAAGIAFWPRPYPVEHLGRLIAEIDLAAPWVRYGAEIDGPHHDLPEQAAAAKQRDRELRRLGWTIDRFPVELVERHPDQFVREVQAAIRSLDPSAIP